MRVISPRVRRIVSCTLHIFSDRIFLMLMLVFFALSVLIYVTSDPVSTTKRDLEALSFPAVKGKKSKEGDA